MEHPTGKRAEIFLLLRAMSLTNLASMRRGASRNAAQKSKSYCTHGCMTAFPAPTSLHDEDPEDEPLEVAESTTLCCFDGWFSKAMLAPSMKE